MLFILVSGKDLKDLNKKIKIIFSFDSIGVCSKFVVLVSTSLISFCALSKLHCSLLGRDLKD